MSSDDRILAKLLKNVKAYEKDSKSRIGTEGRPKEICFLMLGGSFNPIHSQHIAALQMSRERLQEEGYVVLAGFLGTSSDGYLLHRNNMCSLACDSSDWIEAVPWGCASQHRIAQGIVSLATPRMPEGYRLRCFQVCGADHCARGYLCKNTVCALRPEYTKAVKKLLKNKSKHIIPSTFYTTRDELKAVSSTKIRDLIHKGDWKALSHQKMVADNVITYIQKHSKMPQSFWLACNSKKNTSNDSRGNPESAYSWHPTR
ncbi:hypothetical protein AAMO2058_001334800 [Amorphochlora amoebiformis]